MGEMESEERERERDCSSNSNNNKYIFPHCEAKLVSAHEIP
jgi:hypothetical protein